MAIIYDKDGNASAASAIKTELIKAGSSQEIFFTCPASLGERASSDEVFLNAEPSL